MNSVFTVVLKPVPCDGDGVGVYLWCQKVGSFVERESFPTLIINFRFWWGSPFLHKNQTKLINSFPNSVSIILFKIKKWVGYGLPKKHLRFLPFYINVVFCSVDIIKVLKCLSTLPLILILLTRYLYLKLSGHITSVFENWNFQFEVH